MKFFGRALLFPIFEWFSSFASAMHCVCTEVWRTRTEFWFFFGDCYLWFFVFWTGALVALYLLIHSLLFALTAVRSFSLVLTSTSVIVGRPFVWHDEHRNNLLSFCSLYGSKNKKSNDHQAVKHNMFFLLFLDPLILCCHPSGWKFSSLFCRFFVCFLFPLFDAMSSAFNTYYFVSIAHVERVYENKRELSHLCECAHTNAHTHNYTTSLISFNRSTIERINWIFCR